VKRMKLTDRMSLSALRPKFEPANEEHSDLGDIILQLKAMTSWGPGIVPHFHHENLGSSGVVRGHNKHAYSSTRNSSLHHNSEDAAISYMAAKVWLSRPMHSVFC
jgi:hypothetical protein